VSEVKPKKRIAPTFVVIRKITKPKTEKEIDKRLAFRVRGLFKYGDSIKIQCLKKDECKKKCQCGAEGVYAVVSLDWGAKYPYRTLDKAAEEGVPKYTTKILAEEYALHDVLPDVSEYPTFLSIVGTIYEDVESRNEIFEFPPYEGTSRGTVKFPLQVNQDDLIDVYINGNKWEKASFFDFTGIGDIRKHLGEQVVVCGLFKFDDNGNERIVAQSVKLIPDFSASSEQPKDAEGLDESVVNEEPEEEPNEEIDEEIDGDVKEAIQPANGQEHSEIMNQAKDLALEYREEIDYTFGKKGKEKTYKITRGEVEKVFYMLCANPEGVLKKDVAPATGLPKTQANVIMHLLFENGHAFEQPTKDHLKLL